MQSTNKIKIWISTFRLRTLPLALASMLGGAYLAKLHHCFDTVIFVLSCLTTVLLQVLSNIANDYGDAVNGADNNGRLGPQRAVSSGLISKDQMKIAIIIFVALSLFSGTWLLWQSFKNIDIRFVFWFIIGVLGILAAIKYTAGANPYGYKGLGDLFVFIFFGLVALVGSFFLYYKSFHWHTLPLAIVFGLLSAAVLNVNNIRDIETEIKAVKNTLAVKLGKKSAIIYQIYIIIISAVILVTFLFVYSGMSYVFIALEVLLFFFVLVKNISLFVLLDAEKQTNVLKLTAMATFGISFILIVFS